MKLKTRLLNIALLLAGLGALPSANAGLVFEFTMNLTSGPNTGTIAGTLDLDFVSAGGSGTGAASSLLLTSLPASYGTLAGGNSVTAWAHQIANSFSVVNGAITEFAFFAVTGGSTSDDAFLWNSTGVSQGSFGAWHSVGNLNELSKTASVFGYNFGGFSGVSFTPVQGGTVPEPATVGLVVAAALAASSRRKRAEKA